MDLVRDLLLSLEAENDDRLTSYSYEDRARHFQLLLDAGLVLGVVSGSERDPGRYMAHRITWAGHEFIALMREDTLWKRARETIMREGVSWSFQLLLQWAAAQVPR